MSSRGKPFEKSGALSDHQRLIRRLGVAPLIYQYGEKVIAPTREAGSCSRLRDSSLTLKKNRLWTVAYTVRTSPLVPFEHGALLLYDGPELVWSVAFSPDGKSLVSASVFGTVLLWDVKSGTQTRTFQRFNPRNKEGDINPAYSVAFSPDESVLAVGTLRGIMLWDVKGGEAVIALSQPSNRAHSTSPSIRFNFTSWPAFTRVSWRGQRWTDVVKKWASKAKQAVC